MIRSQFDEGILFAANLVAAGWSPLKVITRMGLTVQDAAELCGNAAEKDMEKWNTKEVFIRDDTAAVAEKKVIDATCGNRSIWFDKRNPVAVYCDVRREEYYGLWKDSVSILDINPDIICDFTALPFRDNTFTLAVFDPPHLSKAGSSSWLVKKYGRLDDTWPQMLHDGFAECMRVLKPDGVLIFKWSEHEIPAEEVWKAIGQKPLFGHHSGKQSLTFWGCFMKLNLNEEKKK